MGRPKRGVMSSFDPAIVGQIDEYRPGKGGWGALTIKVELGFEELVRDKPIPSRSLIALYLKEQGRTRAYQKHVLPPTPPCFAPERPHDLWQLDAEGNKKVKGLGTVCIINVKDIFSKAYAGTLPLLFGKPCNHPCKEDYQRLMRLCFLEFGMNRQLQVDHESVFFDNNSKSPFPTEFHLWLTGMGIVLCFTPKGKPHKQGAVERSHQTMNRQVTEGKSFSDERELFAKCQQRRQRLNHDIPSSSTANKPPLVACPQAAFSGRHYSPDIEAELFDFTLIQDYLSEGKWYRLVATSSTVSLGGKVYYLPNAKPKTEVVIRYARTENQFLFYDSDNNLVDARPAQGLSFKELAGDLDDFKRFLDKYKDIIKVFKS